MFSVGEDVEAAALSKRGWSISAIARHLADVPHFSVTVWSPTFGSVGSVAGGWGRVGRVGSMQEDVSGCG